MNLPLLDLSASMMFDFEARGRGVKIRQIVVRVEELQSWEMEFVMYRDENGRAGSAGQARARRATDRNHYHV